MQSHREFLLSSLAGDFHPKYGLKQVGLLVAFWPKSTKTFKTESILVNNHAYDKNTALKATQFLKLELIKEFANTVQQCYDIHSDNLQNGRKHSLRLKVLWPIAIKR